MVVREAVSKVFANRLDVQAAYIFGSVVTGRARPNSDIDIAVLVHPKVMRGDTLKYRLDLIADLSSALQRSDVDVVLVNQATPALAHNIITKGVLVFERSRSARIAFQIRTLNIYMDTEPMRRLQLESLKRRYLGDRTSG